MSTRVSHPEVLLVQIWAALHVLPQGLVSPAARVPNSLVEAQRLAVCVVGLVDHAEGVMAYCVDEWQRIADRCTAAAVGDSASIRGSELNRGNEEDDGGHEAASGDGT